MSRLSFHVLFTDQPERKPAIVSDDDAWAVLQLVAFGKIGCTPIDDPAPHWSSYVSNLRKVGVDVKTIHEAHRGEVPGCHARCVLRSNIQLESMDGTAAA